MLPRYEISWDEVSDPSPTKSWTHDVHVLTMHSAYFGMDSPWVTYHVRLRHCSVPWAVFGLKSSTFNNKTCSQPLSPAFGLFQFQRLWKVCPFWCKFLKGFWYFIGSLDLVRLWIGIAFVSRMQWCASSSYCRQRGMDVPCLLLEDFSISNLSLSFVYLSLSCVWHYPHHGVKFSISDRWFYETTFPRSALHWST